MNKIYIVYECDEHRSYDSFCIKLISSNKKITKKIYNKILPEFKKDGVTWFLNFAEYEPNSNANEDDNILRELTNILTTEK